MRLLPLLLLAACTGETVCTDLAAVSVTVSVTDADTGATVPDPTVTFSSGGDAEACTDWGDGTWACGFEVEGELEIRVEADGYQAHTETVTVGADECHVIGEALDVALVPVACVDDSIAPSLVLTVSGTGWAETYPIDDATARYTADGVEQDCEHGGDNTYVCGWEVSGEIDWTVSAPGHTEATGTVTVGTTADGCHVDTEEVDVLLECTTC